MISLAYFRKLYIFQFDPNKIHKKDTDQVLFPSFRSGNRVSGPLIFDRVQGVRYMAEPEL